MITFYKNNDNIVRIDGARNKVTGKLIVAASVVATLVVTSNQSQVAGFTQPFTLSAVSGVKGSYAGVVPKEAALVVGTSYTVNVTFVGAGGERAFISELVEVLNRED